MWIAKPIHALSEEEKNRWKSSLSRSALRDHEEAPIAQTLTWAYAIAAAGGTPSLIFDPEECVGGIVFSTQDPVTKKFRYECVNGPLLDWDDAKAAPRQLATFAMAVSKLDPARFQSLSIRPRWREGQSARRLPLLPIQAFASTQATTLHLDLTGENPEISFEPRLKRTLRVSEKNGITAHWDDLHAENLADFSKKMAFFGSEREFTVPSPAWFKALTSGDDSLRFALVTATTLGDEAQCQLLIALHGTEAHYLFGHETRATGLQSSLSPSAIAHRFAIRKSIQAGMKIYDFNGFMENVPTGHSYAGVTEFKRQFGATVVRYEVPEFQIE
jgi:hypothetical protein